MQPLTRETTAPAFTALRAGPFGRRSRKLAGLVLTAVAVLGGCRQGAERESSASSSTQAAPPPGAAGLGSPGAAARPARKKHRKNLYSVPELTPEALRVALEQRCQAAKAQGRPVLLEFSAGWCRDCLRLQSMKQLPALQKQLASVELLTVNVGDFDQHQSLLEAFGVKAIARWELLQPGECSAPPWQWARLGSRTLEPETGASVSAVELSQWLAVRKGASEG